MPQPRPARALSIVVTGGGTGGHVYPALAVARALAAEHGVEVTWVGAAGSLEERTAASNGIAFRRVATGKLRRASNPLKMITVANVRDMLRVPLGIAQAVVLLARTRPDAVLATGGYVAIPVGIAAKVTRRALIVHEQTVRLGLANRLLARGRARVAASSESTLGLLPPAVRERAVVTGNPTRPELADGDAGKAIAALGLTGFDRTRPTVYVTGGAQGSVQINTLISGLLPWLLEHADVVHQSGQRDLPRLEQEAAALPDGLRARYHLTAFVGPELPDVLALADVMVSRAGAGTIAEITALGKPAILIPLASSAGGEQEHNAAHLQAQGAAAALLGGRVDAAALRSALENLLADPEARAQMAANAKQAGRPDAANRLVEVVLAAAAG